MQRLKKCYWLATLPFLLSSHLTIAKERQWLAGDHHVHTHWSVTWDNSVTPPKPIKAGDAVYSYDKNARTAKQYGLTWLVNTDHGGPNHSDVNYHEAYPELLNSRENNQGLIQFYGIELDTPAGEHSTVIMPIKNNEQQTLFEFQKRYSMREVRDKTIKEQRNTVAHMSEAVRRLDQLPDKPLVFINHPGRTAKGLGRWGDVTPEKIKTWHKSAPDVLVGMEGAPGHQANHETRGGYKNYPTMGGFDQMTAVVGGLWDHLIGMGSKFWITANSDAHKNVREGGHDFFPGEYSKTYVYANKDADDIVDGLRHGRIFVTTGDLIKSLDVELAVKGNADNKAMMGEQLANDKQENMQLSVKISRNKQMNANGDFPSLERIDIIMGAVSPEIEKYKDKNPTTRVIKRIYQQDWQWHDDSIEVLLDVPNDYAHGYVRVRGTNTLELEPDADRSGENPWENLWFYSNPIFW